eukprot:gb/GECG01015644.1/.p1 GENE.gb/GECG01015644.1/~~gb/GECG01015644.1/.p1  ORF type:complete len:561 (+),score=57.79 gb/GECG01015644.1/:1-1683(+)
MSNSLGDNSPPQPEKEENTPLNSANASTLERENTMGVKEAEVAAPDAIHAEMKWPWRLYVAAVVVVMASFLSGWHTSVLNTVISSEEPVPKGSLTKALQLTDEKKEIATAITIGGAAVGSFLSILPKQLGYRWSMLMVSLTYLGGTVFSLFSVYSVLLVGRFIVGVAAGLAGILAPVLLAEIAPPAARGFFTTFHQLAITIGILSSGLLGYIFVSFVDSGWRWLFGFGLIPAMLQFVIGWIVLPESPRWLLRNKTKDDVEKMLRKLRPDGFDISSEVNDMADEAEAENREKESVTWGAVLWPQYRRTVVIGIGMLSFACWTGINSVIFYSSQIFEFAGVKESLLSTVIVFGLNVVMTVICVTVIDRVGRKKLLVTGSTFMVIALITMGSVLQYSKSKSAGIITVACVLLYVSGFAISWGGVGFTMVGEVVPTCIRQKVMSVSTLLNWIGNLALSAGMLSFIQVLGGGSSKDEKRIGVGRVYWLFAGVSLCAWLFAVLVVPETKGKSLEELQRLLAPKTTRSGDVESLEKVSLLSTDSGEFSDYGRSSNPENEAEPVRRRT